MRAGVRWTPTIPLTISPTVHRISTVPAQRQTAHWKVAQRDTYCTSPSLYTVCVIGLSESTSSFTGLRPTGLPGPRLHALPKTATTHGNHTRLSGLVDAPSRRYTQWHSGAQLLRPTAASTVPATASFGTEHPTSISYTYVDRTNKKEGSVSKSLRSHPSTTLNNSTSCSIMAAAMAAP